MKRKINKSKPKRTQKDDDSNEDEEIDIISVDPIRADLDLSKKHSKKDKINVKDEVKDIESKIVQIDKLLKQLPKPIKQNTDAFINTIRKLYGSDSSDIIIRVKDKSYPLHRFLLSIHSPVFKKMFKDQPVQNEIRISHEGIPADIFPIFFQFFYCSDIFSLSTSSNMYYLLSLASHYEVKLLEENILSWLKENITINQVSNLIQLSNLLSIPALNQTVVEFCIANFEEIILEENFKELDFLFLKNLLSRDDLIVSNEIVIFDAISKKRPSSEHKELYELVRFPHIPAYILYYQIEGGHFATKENNLGELILEAYRYQSDSSLGINKPRSLSRNYLEFGRRFWKATNLSKVPEGKCLKSPEMKIRDLDLYATLDPMYKGESVALFLYVNSAKFPCEITWSVNFFSHTKPLDVHSLTYSTVFEKPIGWGHTSIFSSMKDKILKDKSLLMNDTLLIEFVIHEVNKR